jgi:hypothetical protein
MDKILEIACDVGDFIRFYPLFKGNEIMLLGFLIVIIFLGFIYRSKKKEAGN